MDDPGSASELQMIDYLGGNGTWRQKKAREEFRHRKQEALLKQQQNEILAREKERRREEIAAWRQRQKEEEVTRRWEIERHNREAERQLAEERRRKEESLETKRRAEELERLAHMPKPCEACSSTGNCPSCSGKGHVKMMFLSSTVDEQTLIDFGLRLQGCKDCGGFPHNVTGELRAGSGLCAACGGAGKIEQNEEKLPLHMIISARVTARRFLKRRAPSSKFA